MLKSNDLAVPAQVHGLVGAPSVEMTTVVSSVRVLSLRSVKHK
jgi:hypothetical protein